MAPTEIGISKSDFEGFEVLALSEAESEVEVETMVEAKAEESVVASVVSANFLLETLSRNPRTEEIEEE